MKLSDDILKAAVKVLKDIGGNVDEIAAVRAGGTLDDIFKTAASIAGRNKKFLAAPNLEANLRRGVGNAIDYVDATNLDDMARGVSQKYRNTLPADYTNLSSFDRVSDVLRTAWMPERSAISANNTALARLAQQRPGAIAALEAGSMPMNAYEVTPQTLLTANQMAKKPGGLELIKEVAGRGAADPLYTARAIMNEGLNPTQRELAVTFIGDGMDLNDAIQAAKALA